MLFDQQEIQDRWKEYIKELFKDERREIPQMDNEEGPIILKEEVRKAIHSLRPGKGRRRCHFDRNASGIGGNWIRKDSQAV